MLVCFLIAAHHSVEADPWQRMLQGSDEAKQSLVVAYTSVRAAWDRVGGLRCRFAIESEGESDSGVRVAKSSGSIEWKGRNVRWAFDHDVPPSTPVETTAAIRTAEFFCNAGIHHDHGVLKAAVSILPPPKDFDALERQPMSKPRLVEPPHFFSGLLGAVPYLVTHGYTKVRTARDARGTCITLENNALSRYDFFVDEAAAFRLTKVERHYKDKSVPAPVHFADHEWTWRTVGTVDVVEQYSIVENRRSPRSPTVRPWRDTIRFDRIETNAAIPESRFQVEDLHLPEGARMADLRFNPPAAFDWHNGKAVSHDDLRSGKVRVEPTAKPKPDLTKDARFRYKEEAAKAAAARSAYWWRLAGKVALVLAAIAFVVGIWIRWRVRTA